MRNIEKGTLREIDWGELDAAVTEPLLNHVLTIFSQINAFDLKTGERTSAGIESLISMAQYEAKLLVTPNPESMSNQKLASELLSRHVVFALLRDAETREKLHQYCQKFHPAGGFPLVASPASLYDALVFLEWQHRICARFYDALVERARANPVHKHSIGLAVLSRSDASRFLQKTLIAQVGERWGRLPEDEREEWVNYLLGEWVAKLRDMPFAEMYSEARFVCRVIEKDFSDQWRKEHRQRRFPQGGYAEPPPCGVLDIDTVNLTYSRKGAFSSTRLSALQKGKLGEFLSNGEVEILDAIHQNPDATQREIADCLGYSQSRVSKAKRKFQRFEKKIKKILEIG